MKSCKINSPMLKAGGGLLAMILAPNIGFACACGCGVFDVGTSSMFPRGAGGMFFLEYDYQDQNRNWSGSSGAPAANNDDKEIRTHFITAGVQYMFNRTWGVQVEVPYDYRYFRTASDGGSGTESLNWGSLGDIRLEGIYTGFSEDLSTGLTFGLKLPTGNYSHDPDVVDRDTQIGTGSTDLLLGGFHRQNLAVDWQWFAQAQLDVPTLTQARYRPGVEADAALGIYYNGLSLRSVNITPVAQVIGSERTSDSGAAANQDNSGYQRVLLSPGIEVDLHSVMVYADVEIPVYQHVTGNQVVASELFKVVVSYNF